ncbi:hypothetical protein SH1V18_44590 [Vallitalea longa]|uniref:Uncharacterized protein n=1 Tax=Vallitalea longa TaxID=2936439 RepID=A0A9W5YF90_9FIRM|nr:hypothetical protein [Vallitalea longa]GKX31979.1 hypothetical protein SH1V18_44590 [Vallitalea longa]
MYLNILIVIIIFTVIGITEIVPIKKNNTKKELTIYVLFFTTAFVLMTLYGVGVKIPKISEGLDMIIEKII